MTTVDQQELDKLTKKINRSMKAKGQTRCPRKTMAELRAQGLKRCSSCTKVQLLEDFPGRRKNPFDGKDNQCKKCGNKRNRAYHRKNKEAENTRVLDYYYKNKDALITKKNEYRRNNPVVDRIANGKIRARKKGLPVEEFTAKQLIAFWESRGIDPWVSIYSGEPLTSENYSLDHLVPFAQKGSPGHTMANLVPCTLEENQNKQSKHFVHLLADLHADAPPVVLV